MSVLKKYGGIYIDASIIMNDSFENFLPKENTFDLIAFYCKHHFQHFGKNKIPLVENWILATPPNSPFIKEWLDYLLPVTEIGVNKLITSLSKRNDFDIIKNNLYDLPYFISYLTQQAMLLDNENKFNLYLRCADYSAFYYHKQFGWFNKFKFRELLFFRSEDIKFLPKLIKLTSKERDDIAELHSQKLISIDSYLGQFL